MRARTGLQYVGIAAALLAGAGLAHWGSRKLSQREQQERQILDMIRGCRIGDWNRCGPLLLSTEPLCLGKRDAYACLLLAPLNEKGFGRGAAACRAETRGGCAAAAAHYGIACAGGYETACEILRNHYENPPAGQGAGL